MKWLNKEEYAVMAILWDGTSTDTAPGIWQNMQQAWKTEPI